MMPDDLSHIEEPLRPLAVPIGTLREDPDNVRAHDERNVEAIKASLAAFGQQKPIVVRADGTCVAGSGTLRAAIELGWSYVAAVRTALDGDDATAYAIADNRTAELAAWDDERLALVLKGMADSDFDALVTGFDGEEIEGLLKQFDIAEGNMPILADGERTPFQQMTFILSDEQVFAVKRAMNAAQKAGPFVDTGNANKNGNALARIAEQYLGKCEGNLNQADSGEGR